MTLLVYAGGIAPHRVLPVVVDVGTNNEKLLKDPDYLGTRETRLTGDEYFHFMDEFIQACFHRWPDVIVQFEDFESLKAVALLERYRHRYRCFNDDIQGTGSVTLSGVLSAMRNAGTDIKEAKILCAGAGMPVLRRSLLLPNRSLLPLHGVSFDTGHTFAQGQVVLVFASSWCMGWLRQGCRRLKPKSGSSCAPPRVLLALLTG